MSESSRIETLLEALVDGENVDVEPQSRIETYLLALLNGDTNVKEPQSRIEAYLYQLCKNGMTGGGGGITPTGTLEITENGTHDVTNYASANVNVASSGGGDLDALIEGSITEVSSNATTIAPYKFYNHTSLKTVNLPNVTEIPASCFISCSKLENVYLPEVTKLNSSAFEYCSILKDVFLPAVTYIGDSAFSDCPVLKTIDFSGVTYIGNNAFQRCKTIETANFPMVTTIGRNSFYGCEKLTSVYLPQAVQKMYYNNSIFEACKHLKSISLPKFGELGNYSFRYCYRLTTADFLTLTKISGSGVFEDCSSLKALILRSETMCSLADTNAFTNCHHILGTVDVTYNPNGDKDGYIYVPRALVDTYANATNWVTYASQFRALEDYTVDGTITGELDETKI